MSTRYKFIDKQAVYFTTSAVVGWSDVFTREVYKTILLDSIRHCQYNQGLILHAWVLMTNHLHTICSFKEGMDPGQVWRNIKSFTAMKIIDAIIKNPKESRKENLLSIFEAPGKKSNNNFKYQFWQHENHPVLLNTTEMYDQKLEYIHCNPVTARFVAKPCHWLYSSAIDYQTDKKGLLEIEFLEGL